MTQSLATGSGSSISRASEGWRHGGGTMSKAINKEEPSHCQELRMKAERGGEPSLLRSPMVPAPAGLLDEPIEKPVVKGVQMMLSLRVSLLG